MNEDSKIFLIEKYLKIKSAKNTSKSVTFLKDFYN